MISSPLLGTSQTGAKGMEAASSYRDKLLNSHATTTDLDADEDDEMEEG